MTTPDISLASWFAKRAARTPSRRALTFEDRSWTYAELWQRVERLREFAGRSLARYKLPTRLQIVDVLPCNPAGKVLKFELRNRFAEVNQ